jgi:hypothetical protein
MAAKKSTPTSEVVSEVLKVSTGSIDLSILGTSPLVLNRMSEKAKHELLMPKGRKNAAERATSLKHIPIDEYRASAYTLKDGPTLLALMATAFKGALRSAALDMPGAKKAQIGRLTYIEGDLVGIYGVPKLFMAIVRSADMNKTPDVRTRAIVPEWACQLRVTYVEPLIRANAVINLMAAAGITIGVGDGRPEKGAMSYGQFKIVSPDDANFKRILKEGARKAQQAGLQSPVCYDDETTELLSWFDTERAHRQMKGVA